MRESNHSTTQQKADAVSITSRIVDYRVKAPELVDLVGNGCCSRDGGEVPGNNSAGAGCRRERVATLPSLAAGRTLNPTRRLAPAGDEAR